MKRCECLRKKVYDAIAQLIAEKDIQPLCNIIASDVLSKLDGKILLFIIKKLPLSKVLFDGFAEIFCCFLNLDLALVMRSHIAPMATG